MLKNVLALVAVALFLAGPSFAAGGVSTFNHGALQTQPILVTTLTEILTVELCMDLFEDVNASDKTGLRGEACDADLANEKVFTQNAQITEMKVINKFVGDTAYTCEFTVEVAGTAVAAKTTSATQLVNTIQTFPLALDIADGDLVGIMVGQGVTCGDGTADPVYIVELWGNFVADDAF
jgi:hypothetical protein